MALVSSLRSEIQWNFIQLCIRALAYGGKGIADVPTVVDKMGSLAANGLR
ncbi:MAG: hypothetical protein PVF83_18305 [Anaerolineales bacterium]